MLKAGNQGGRGLDVRRRKAIGPLISVLMPVQNGVKYIGEAIDSIAGQTLMDWELVVIDNASTDGTGAYVKRRAARDPRIVLHRNEEDVGVPAGLSAGLALCRGEWIACMYAEDRAMPDRLERQLAFMLQNRDLAVVSCLAHYINGDGEPMPAIALDPPAHEADECPSRHDDIMRVLQRGAFTRRETAVSAAGRCVASGGSDDIELMNRLAEAGPILVQPEYLMQYRIDNGSQAALWLDLANHGHGSGDNYILARRAGNAARSDSTADRCHRGAGERKTNSRMLSTALRVAGRLTLWPAFRSARLSAQLLCRRAAGHLEAGES